LTKLLLRIFFFEGSGKNYYYFFAKKIKNIIIENIRIKLKIIDMGNIIPLRIIDIKKQITIPKKNKEKNQIWEIV